MVTKKDYWQPPLKGFVKFNIDGASKGNTGTVGYGRDLRDEKGNIIFIFHYHLGKSTNNMAEAMAQKQGLEVDSEIIINVVKGISKGSRLESVSNHWKLIQVYQRIQIHL